MDVQTVIHEAHMKPASLQQFFAVGAFAAIALATTSASAFTGLYVFGDSLSDSGNNRAVLGNSGATQVVSSNSYIPSLPYASGTYSNGPVWVNSFAAGLGLSAFAAPSLGGGGDYAYGGARTTVNGGFGGFPPSATTQVNGFLTGQATIPSTALYVVAIGGNDARAAAEAIAGGAPAPATIAAAAAAYATGVGNIIDSLQAKGATNIVVWDTPNLGRAPASIAAGPAAVGLGTAIAQSFNAALAGRLASETGVTTFDIYGLINTVALNPASYGFSNITDACGAVSGCNASQYLFWDGIHPSAAGHTLIANAMLAVVAVPEPSSMLMLAAGLLMLTMVARRQGLIRSGR
jgi:outer membrane lipase/esterase